MYAFIAWAYLLFFPLLLILLIVVPIKYRFILLYLRSSIQLSLLLYAAYSFRLLIGLYQIRKMFKMSNNNLDYFGSGLVEMLLILILPFLFLHQRILNSWKLGLVLWLLLLHALQKHALTMVWYDWSFVNAILFYISLVTAIYALLWLLKNQTTSLAK